MKFGVLADSFEGAGAKYLTEVEVDFLKSNQHEFQGVNSFWRFLGRASQKIRYPATYYWLDDEEGSEPIRVEAFGTWGDVRKKHAERTEYRLYYSVEADRVVHKARAGDLLVVAKTKEGALLVIICPAKSTIARQLLWLLGLDPFHKHRSVKALGADNSIRLGFAAHAILDDLGIIPEEPEPDALDALIGAFGLDFPPTAEFHNSRVRHFTGQIR